MKNRLQVLHLVVGTFYCKSHKKISKSNSHLINYPQPFIFLYVFLFENFLMFFERKSFIDDEQHRLERGKHIVGCGGSFLWESTCRVAYSWGLHRPDIDKVVIQGSLETGLIEEAWRRICLARDFSENIPISCRLLKNLEVFLFQNFFFFNIEDNFTLKSLQENFPFQKFLSKGLQLPSRTKNRSYFNK